MTLSAHFNFISVMNFREGVINRYQCEIPINGFNAHAFCCITFSNLVVV